MDIVMQVMQKVNEIFDVKYLEALARETGFLKRKRKVNPKAFLENILLMNLSSAASTLDDLVYEFDRTNCSISKQALHKKFNQSAVEFVQRILNKLLEHTFSSSSTCLGFIPSVKNVQVVDSSEIRLHKTLKDLFPQVRNQGAAVKLQALIDVIHHQILALEVRPSKEPDQGYKHHLTYTQAGDLLIGDLGYFCIDSFKEIQTRKGFFLSRYFKKTTVYDRTTEKRMDLRSILAGTQEGTLEFEVKLSRGKFPCRLVAIKLTEEAYLQRLKNLKEKHRKEPRSKSNLSDPLNRWTLLVTNLPGEVEANILWQLYSLRWQIELLFKMMKTFLNLRKIENTNGHRACISLYISLITMTLLSWVAMTIVDQEISLYKASKLFINNIRVFFNLINNKKQCAISWLRDKLYKFALKESRPSRPSTRLSLETRYA